MEGTILIALQAARIGGLAQVAALISALGNASLIWILLGLIFILLADKRNAAITMLVSVVIASVIAIIVSNIVARPYPSETVTGLVPMLGVSHSGYCFPSLYAATGFAAAIVLWLECDRGIGFAAFVFALLESFSRMYLGVNYPSDILVGAILGLAVGVIVHLTLSRVIGLINFEPKAPQRKQVSAGRMPQNKRGRHSL